ncbi:uncharacterized protein EV422DRAFT_515817 [Fimicolochytrium jonesii]|uniref:uncharacterized protein n=1 Tax=Fimicolochytrium jonesii TaxID=1396493 RepID=UPI0022FE3ECD|nr:uncharacterized protein EV422DRAFT_515817 [Fimicolochytrium jonesii]KAI8826219.1 hypothetical protein EV422DRAFT_515817 [Fimicolochytrium jonesii]
MKRAGVVIANLVPRWVSNALAEAPLAAAPASRADFEGVGRRGVHDVDDDEHGEEDGEEDEEWTGHFGLVGDGAGMGC